MPIHSTVIQQIQEVMEFLQPQIPDRPEIAIVLGSGLGHFADNVENSVTIPYEKIRHFEKPSVDGHQGKLVFGKIRGVSVVVLQGRWHYYEGHSMNSIVLPTRVFAALGAHTILLTNAAGGVNLSFNPGDLMVIEDHINLMGDNPLRGKDSAHFGPRFPDMSETYSLDCIQSIKAAAEKQNIDLKRGVYAGLQGPTYETPAEVRMLRTLGADAVGMSTVPEAIAARHLGMRVAGISFITNMAAGIESKTLDHTDVQMVASRIMDRFGNLIMDSIPEMARNVAHPLPKAPGLKR